MANTSNFLSNVWQELKQENKKHSSFIAFLLVLCTIPMPYAVNNIFLGFFVVSVFFQYKTLHYKNNYALVLSIALFGLMAISYFWSIDSKATLKAIPKEIALLIIPICFLLVKPFSKEQRQKIVKYYSYSMLLFAVFYLLKATVRFVSSNDTSVFFYHELVTKNVNAVHVSVYMSLAFFYFFCKSNKNLFKKIATGLLFGIIILLSSKLIIIITLLLVLLFQFFISKESKKLRLRNLIVFTGAFFALLFFSKIKDRFILEIQSNTKGSVSHTVLEIESQGINVVSIEEAWNKPVFSPNDFFPGTAFRVYQARVFFELLKEETIFWKGFGLNASYKKLEQKSESYNLFKGDEINEGYQNKNFHNQYIQNFAELGFLGFLILLLLVAIVFKNALQQKDFIQIAFAVLMISLFLTESFLWRQRGVVFFTSFYCLFTATQLLPTKKD